MIPVTPLSGKQVALFGLGGSGRATARALLAGGCEVIAWDDNPRSVETATGEGINCADLRSVDLSSCSALVLSPGVPLTHPAPHWSVALAHDAGLEIIGDIELFQRVLQASGPSSQFVAITGTNGKSTTTALTAHILRNAGRNVQMGGNIGIAVLELEPPVANTIYVVECSSYQIDLAPNLAPDVGVLLNVTPDHLDRHGTIEQYAEIKSRLVFGAQAAVVGVDDSFGKDTAAKLLDHGSLAQISAQGPLDSGYFSQSDDIIQASGAHQSVVATLSSAPALAGRHNAQNASAAVATCLSLGLAADEIQSGLDSFPGLAHRMERVGQHASGTLYINDSKATNAEAVAPALAAFPSVRWILGGVPKTGGIKPLEHLFGHVAKAYLIGEAAGDFAGTLSANDIDFEISETLDQAVTSAHHDADANDTVLLSPACASFDQFPNFERRGDAFRDAVLALDGVTAIGPSQSNLQAENA